MDYRQRLKYEYEDLLCKYDKLRSTLKKYELGKLEFKLDEYDIKLLKEQFKAMQSYLWVLELRLEKIDMEGVKWEE